MADEQKDALIAELTSTLNIVRGTLPNMMPKPLVYSLLTRVEAVLDKAASARVA